MIDKRNELLAEAKSIVDAADAESRDLTPDESKRFDALMAEADTYKIDPAQLATRNAVRPEGMHGGQPINADAPALKSDQRMSDWAQQRGRIQPDYRSLSLNKYLRGIITGNWQGADMERRAMSESVLGSGGYMVPTPLALNVIDLARNKAQIFNAGATTLPMETATLKIARLTGDIASNWKAENATATSSDASFDSVTLTAKTLVALASLSIELAEDAPNAFEVVSHSIAQSLALALDYAAFRGDGASNNPTGIRNQTNVVIDSTTMGANGSAPTNYDFLSKAVQTIAGNNGTPNAAVYSARTAFELDRLKDTMNNPLRMPDSVLALNRLYTNQIPNNLTQGTANTCSEAYVGQFNECLIGIRDQLVLEVSREASDAAGSAFQSMRVLVRAYLRADVQLAHPQHFVVVTGIL